MAEERDFRTGIWKIFARLSPLVVLILLALAAAANSVRDERPYEVGSKAIVFDRHAYSVLKLNEQKQVSERMRVLTPDLENGRGLIAIDCDGGPDGHPPCLPIEHLVGDKTIAEKVGDRRCDTQLLAVDAWEGVSGLCVERNDDAKKPREGLAWLRHSFSDIVSGHQNHENPLRSITLGTLLPITRTKCPDEQCLEVEHGGLAADQAGDIVVAEPHNDRVAKFGLSELGLNAGAVRSLEERQTASEPAGEILFASQVSGRIHDVTLMPNGQMAIAESSVDPKQSGVRLILKGKVLRDLIPGSYAPNPVGVFFSDGSGRVYATDVSNGRQRWMYVEAKDGRWSEPKTFWTVEDRSTGTPALRHLTTAWSKSPENRSTETVFAGGPDGLYIINPTGILLAKYSLGRPLNGMDWGRRGELFFTAGRYVGVLRLAETLQLKADRVEPLPPIPGPADPPGGAALSPPATVSKDPQPNPPTVPKAPEPNTPPVPKAPRPTVKQPPKSTTPKCICGKGRN